MNIYTQEFKMNLRSVVTWSITVVVIIFIFLAIFSSMSADAQVLNDMLDQFPKELLIAFGMVGMDFSTILGLYSLAFVFCQICLAIQAANYGFSLVSIEERELTADFLLAKPVSRTTIMSSKLLSAVTGLTITNLFVWIGSFIFINIFNHGSSFDRKPLLLLLASIIVFQLFFLTVGLVISLLVKRIRNVTAFTMALVFGMYLLNAFGDMLGDDTLEVITPFNHFDPNYIINNAAYNFPVVLVSVALIVVSLVGSYMLYTRRDMRAAV
jgi:ABC-2 type transport system permease protein